MGGLADSSLKIITTRALRSIRPFHHQLCANVGFTDLSECGNDPGWRAGFDNASKGRRAYGSIFSLRPTICVWLWLVE